MSPVFALKMLIGAAFAILALAFVISFVAKRRKVLRFESVFGFDPKGISPDDDDYWMYEDHVLVALSTQGTLIFNSADSLRQRIPPPASAYMEYCGTVKPHIEKFLEMFELAHFFGFKQFKKPKEKVLDLQKDFEKASGIFQAGPHEESDYFLEKMIRQSTMIL
jgi:hypothetical protein